ncbi:MAG: hypothetical protein ABIO02_04955 [Patescibacteria group bacterium]
MQSSEEIPSLDKKPEIIHSGSLDIIITPSADPLEIKTVLIPEILKGISSSWIPYDPHPFDHDNDDPDDLVPHYFIDRATNTRYFAKHKRYSDRYTQSLEVYRKDEYRRMNYAFSSVMNEIGLSTRIKQLYDSAESAELAKLIGYKGLKFIEPLLATINRETKEKCVVYPFVEGSNLFQENSHELDLISNKSESTFIEAVTEMFKVHGMQIADLGTHQFIVPKKNSPDNGVVYVVDSEAYSRL